MTDRCPVGMKVQSIIIPFELTTRKREAERLVRRRKGTIRYCDKTGQSFRFRQLAPSKFVVGSLRTIDLGKGVRAVVGCPRDNPGPRPKHAKARRALKQINTIDLRIMRCYYGLRKPANLLWEAGSETAGRYILAAQERLAEAGNLINRAVRLERSVQKTFEQAPKA